MDGFNNGSRRRLGWGVVLGVLLLQVWSRYLPSPWAVFVADDWTNYARSTLFPSMKEAVTVSLQDPNRPLSTTAVAVGYRLFGPRPVYWTILSLLSHSLMLWFIMKMGLELTGSRRVAALQGALFALLPNLHETWQWSTQILNEVTCGLLFYALAGWLFVAHVRRGGAAWLAGAALAYAVGLFSYEQGILLPAVGLAILPWRRSLGRALLKMVPFGAAFLLYAAWRATDSFGLNTAWHYPDQMKVGFSLWGIGWNARQLVHWWIGDRFFGAILSGLMSFSTLAPWTRRLLALGNIAAISAAVFLWRRLASDKEDALPAAFSAAQVAGFGVLWAGASMATILASYTAGRLNILPAMGLTLLGGLLLARLPWCAWATALFVPALVILAANQGTSENFRQAGEFNWRVYDYLRVRQAEWQDKDVLLFDTGSLRHRQTRGLVTPASALEYTWAEYGNTLLFRGFVPLGMVQRLAGAMSPHVQVIQDVECGARVDGSELAWHTRYRPDEPFRTPLDRVFIVDVFQAAQSVPPRPPLSPLP